MIYVATTTELQASDLEQTHTECFKIELFAMDKYCNQW